MRDSVSIAIAGSGGAGVMTAAGLLLEAAAKAGYYGLFTRLAGAQVRGGEAAALVTLGVGYVESPPDAYDLFVGIDWGSVEGFAVSIPLDRQSLILCDPRQGAVPKAIEAYGAARLEIPFTALARVPGGRANMVALGAAASLLGLPDAIVEEVMAKRLAQIGAKAPAGGKQCAAAGRKAVEGLVPPRELRLEPASAKDRARWVISGDQALALGALRGGVRFAAGYPITPATEVVEWLAPVMEEIGGRFVQAEDELAALNLCLGSSYGGVPAMTVTSGPGLSLMVETLGLACSAEIPVLLIDVQRCGPSTGIASKTEQSDLNLALYGAHGDAPRIVLSPTSARDGLRTTQWAVELAERLQTPVVLLSDQQMGQAEIVMDAAPGAASAPQRLLAQAAPDAPYKRYAVSDSGLSPISSPGAAGLAWIGEGLTHTETSAASSSAKDHMAQIAKRARKLALHDFGPAWGDVEGDGPLAVIAWGSSVAPAREAVARCRANGMAIRLVAPRLIAPFPAKGFQAALAGVRRALVVELNHSGQLYRYLRSQLEGETVLSSHARPGPLVFRPGEIRERIGQWAAS